MQDTVLERENDVPVGARNDRAPPETQLI